MKTERAGAEPRLFGRYRAGEVLARLEKADVIAAIERRGYAAVEFELDAGEGPLLHAKLHAVKNGRRELLLDACMSEMHLGEAETSAIGIDDGLDLLVVNWLREQDPSARFDERHRRLPLQDHPGLGVLRRAFSVVVDIAREMGKDGVAALPKFFHDAAIFFQSRLFLFLDAADQGRFEALLRDLAGLGLGDASLALAGDAVVDGAGRGVRWEGRLQVMPLSPALTAYFHSPAYEAACRDAAASSSYKWNEAALGRARAIFEASAAATTEAGAD